MTASLAVLMSAAAALAQGAVGVPDFATSPAARGVWAYRPAAHSSEAIFTNVSGGIAFAIRCTRTSRTVTLSRTTTIPSTTMMVWTSSAQRSLPARYEPNAVRISADLSAGDSFLDAMAFSRGRVAISIPGAVPLLVVPGPEAARVFEDCRI